MNEISTTNNSQQSPFDAIKQVRDNGSEFWSARDLAVAMEYDQWRNFDSAVSRARAAAKNQGYEPEHHIAGASKMVELGSGAHRAVDDWHLTRFGAYLTVMNGDPRKPEVAAAQAYFAIRTREAETRPQRELTGPELMARAVLEAAETIKAADAKIAQLTQTVEHLQPRADYVDNYVADEDLIQFRTIAKRLGLQETALRDALVEHKWIYREKKSRWSNSQGKKVSVYRYSAMADKRDYFTPCLSHEAPRFGGEVMHYLKVTPVGAVAIQRAAVRWGLIDSTDLTVIEGGAA